MSRAGELRSMMQLIALTDPIWQHKIPEDDHACTPWMPFPVPEFIGLLAQAAGDAPGDQFRFLEVGCGPGTKMLIAQQLFGLDVHGIDRVPEYVEQAQDLTGPGTAELADALGWKSYGDYDVIWFNRAFRDPGKQRELETQVWQDTAPGTVVMCANLENRPPSTTWFPIEDSWESRYGAWWKVR